MAFGLYLSVALLLSVLAAFKCDHLPDGVVHMECHDRFFMIAGDLLFTGDDPRFEAVDDTGIYPITTRYAAECGYSISVLGQPSRVELRASYFSCHTDNKDDVVFTFNFNLLVTNKETEVSYSLNKTCSPTLPWSPREVTCEVNYMEVSVRSDVACPTGTRKDDWDAVVRTVYNEATADWQVMFQLEEHELMPMNLSKAREQGYVFDLTDGRLVFRTPYGQPDSFSTMVNGVPVEVVHATLFSRQSWVVLLVDLVAACSMYDGEYDEDGYIMWETPEMLHPLASGLRSTQVNIGANGELFEPPIAEERGYIIEKHNNTVRVSIPYNTEGGYRKSLVMSHDLYEFYAFHLYLEQISLDEHHIDTRLRFHRTLTTPLLLFPIFAENKTVVEERMFTIYLGNIPEDVMLAAVRLNGQEVALFTNSSSSAVSKVLQPNNTHGFILKVPFDDPVVTQQFSKKDATMQHLLDINYTLTVLPENEPYYYSTSVVALTDVSPPVFDAVCMESGIIFSVEYRPFDDLWYVSVGSEPLTSDLASRHGYIVTNDSRSLQLEVPLFTHGYKYKDITLKGFSGSFEILVRDRETSEVQSSTIKTCLFTAAEVIVCSPDGRMTVVADLSLAIPPGGTTARAHLVDKYCQPKEVDGTRALFSVPLNSCGAKVKLWKEYVTYENEIFFSRKFGSTKNPTVSSNVDRLTMQCTYPLAGLHRLFSVYRFESDTPGVGRILHSTRPTEGLESPTTEPTTVLQTPVSMRHLSPVSIRRAYYGPAQHIKVSSFLKKLSRKSAGGSLQSKVKTA